MDYPLIYAADSNLDAVTRASLARRCRAGELVRLRRGIYVETLWWKRQPLWEQQRARIGAVLSQSGAGRTAAERSAAVVWGIPVIGSPPEVTLLALPPTHGRRRGGVHWIERPLLEPIVLHDGMNVTSRAQTVLDMAAHLAFEHAVPAADHVLRTDPVNLLPALSREGLMGLAYRLPSGARRSRALTVLRFADARADSPGESVSRAVMHRMGFPPPELQHVFDTPDGRFRTDFFWREYNIVGEFDGAVKYAAGNAGFPGQAQPQDGAWGGPVAPQGREGWDVVLKEKRREDAIRALGVKFVRWSWADVGRPRTDPQSLVQRLSRAGLPHHQRPALLL